MYSLLTCESFKSANHKKIVLKIAHLWKVCKSIKFFKSENLRICDLRNLFAEHPPLMHLQFCRNIISFTREVAQHPRVGTKKPLSYSFTKLYPPMGFTQDIKNILSEPVIWFLAFLCKYGECVPCSTTKINGSLLYLFLLP